MNLKTSLGLASSSQESFESFTKRIKGKWGCDQPSEEVIQTTSHMFGSSGDSDVDLDPSTDENQKIVLKKKSEDKVKHNEDVKKKQIEKEEDKNSSQKNDKKRKLKIPDTKLSKNIDRNSSDDEIAKKTKKESKKDKEMRGDGDVESLSNRREHNKNKNKEDSERNRLKKQKEVTKDECKAKKRDDTDEDPAENRKRVKKNKEIQQDANKEKGDNDDDDPTENVENVMKNKEIQQHANKDKEDTAIEDLSKSVEKSKKNKKKNQEDGEGNQLKKLKKVTKDDSKAKDGDNTDDEDPAGNMKNFKKNKEIQQDANKEKGDTDDDDPAENFNKNNEIQQNANTEKEETAIEDPAENVEKSKKKNKEDRIRNQTKNQKVNAVKNGSTNSHVDSDENKKRSKQYSEVKTQKHGDVEIKEEDRSVNEDGVDKVENLGNVEENCEEIKGDDEEKQDSDDEDANKKYEQYLKNMEKNKPVLLTLDSSSEEIDEKDAAKEYKVARNVDKEKKKNKTVVVTLDSSSEEIDKKDVAKEDKKESKGKEKSLKKRSELNDRRPRSTLLSSESSDEDGPPPENRSCSDKENKKKTKKKEKDEDDSVSPSMLSSGDSSDSEIIPQKKIRKKETSSDDDLEVVENKKTKKRKRVRCADSSDESGGSGLDPSQKSSKGESPGKGGRKNIKKIKDRGDLEAATKEAAEEEKERRKRIEERQKLFNQMFEIKETKILDKLVLDFDPKEKKELLSVHKDLVEKMKPHQAKGVKFMWDSCFESLSQLKSKKGSGCILAHCMGLGKTFQVISLVHTILNKEETNVHTVMVVCPLSTVLNWYNEFGKWLDGVEGGDDIEVFHLTRYKLNPDRARELRRWQHNGGVLIIGYEMFRNLTCETNKKFKARMKKDFLETLIDPGADLIVCDEGHMLKNEATALSKAMSRVKTMRRVVLTGTPMQNNLKEYHCMVQFVKPSLLGTRKEFLNRFVNPITNGQFVDSTPADVKVMKRRAHVLHKMLEGLVQRFDYNVLTPFLPPKHEYVISLCLTELQEKLYRHYLENLSQKSDNTKAGSRLFQDWQALGRIWTHPRVLKMSTDKANWLKEKKALEESDSEGSLKDFIDDDEDNTTSEESSDDDNSSVASIKSDEKKKKKPTRKPVRQTRSMRLSGKNTAHLDSSEDEKEEEVEVIEETSNGGAWWGEMVEPQDLDDIRHSSKLTVLFAILKECEMIEDKVLVFSQSLFSLDLIEHFLDKIDEATQKGQTEENLGNHQGTWSKGLDYFRLDGSTSSENRNIWCNSFNREDNPRARLFLISTRAGGLGINLTAANRVIIFDASWNPSHDVQSIFRIYRFGQKKPCYVYRFIAHGTMEERVYDRQVAKQSMSNRVVDEQQVHRHFSMNDLNELYTFTPATKKEDRPTPALPKDGLMAEILSQFSDSIEKYHEHDSLLENVVEEELNEEERQLAWEDYENDKKRATMPAYNTGAATNTINNQIEYLRQALKAKYPDKPEQELHQMLIIQVSMLMKQQQMAAAAAGTQGSTTNFQQQPQMYNKNLTPEQLYMQQQQMRMQYLQQMQAQQAANMQQSQSKGLNYQQQMMMQQQQQQANLARLQMQQMQQKMSQQSLLQTQLSQPMKSAQMMNKPTLPRMNSLPFQALELERMKHNYQASRQQSPGVKITELPEESKPSDSSI